MVPRAAPWPPPPRVAGAELLFTCSRIVCLSEESRRIHGHAARRPARAQPANMATVRARHLSDYHDMTTIVGRFQYNWSFFSPINLLRFGHADVMAANATLDSPTASADEVQHAMLVRAACAPSGELLPWFFRTSGWAIGGTPIIAFMVLLRISRSAAGGTGGQRPRVFTPLLTLGVRSATDCRSSALSSGRRRFGTFFSANS